MLHKCEQSQASYTLTIFRISRCFHKTQRSTKHTIHFSYITKFCVSLMLQKNYLWNPWMFHKNAAPGTKWCEIRKKRGEIPHCTLFVFRILGAFDLVVKKILILIVPVSILPLVSISISIWRFSSHFLFLRKYFPEFRSVFSEYQFFCKCFLVFLNLC